MTGWIGVDLDGTLAHYDHWRGADHIGDPIMLMVDRVRGWLAAGKDVRIFTARIGQPEEADVAKAAIEAWCLTHLGRVLPITATKDMHMVELWDDRCVQIIPNTGRRADDADEPRGGSMPAVLRTPTKPSLEGL